MSQKCATASRRCVSQRGRTAPDGARRRRLLGELFVGNQAVAEGTHQCRGIVVLIKIVLSPDRSESAVRIEIDFDGKRMIASDSAGTYTGLGMGSGLLTGMLMGHLLSNQRAAGIRQGHFANRNVQSRASYARSRTRSGGRFGGK